MTRRVTRVKRDPSELRNLVAEPDLRKPFIQLRWARLEFETRNSPYQWICYYELVIPLRRWDIRRENARGIPEKTSLTVKISGPTKRGSDVEPCRLADGSLYWDPPWRDGVHAEWDAALLGDLEIVVIACDGTVIRKPKDGAA